MITGWGSRSHGRPCRLTLEPIASVLAELQLNYELEDMRFSRRATKLELARVELPLVSGPGFPKATSVSLVTVLATQAEKAGHLVHDWLYELRLFASNSSARCAPICSSAIRTASS